MNNELQLPTSQTINLIAYRLYETERTIDINLQKYAEDILKEEIIKAKSGLNTRFFDRSYLQGNENDFSQSVVEYDHCKSMLSVYEHSVFHELYCGLFLQYRVYTGLCVRTWRG